ncbi:hypothetical protein MHK_003217 [Candidatus Magnetomorum sp. HK-1]|nr:hypothetical protein MHK_003217 [Candidatus Magnetomorum sp. HK-1]
MTKKIITFATMLCLFVCFLPVKSFAGSNDQAGCTLDMDISTHEYIESMPYADLESSSIVSVNDQIFVAIVAQNVRDLDTYQVEITYDSSRLEFTAGYEDNSVSGLVNLLKINGGKTLGFQAIKRQSGLISIANSLVGSNVSQAPEGTGIIAILQFSVISDGDCNINLTNVRYVDANNSEDSIKNIKNAHLKAF